MLIINYVLPLYDLLTVQNHVIKLKLWSDINNRLNLKLQSVIKLKIWSDNNNRLNLKAQC